MPSNHLILSHSLLLLPSIFLSIRVFPNESVLCIKWPKYWSFSFNISPSNEYSGLISFRMGWLDLLQSKGLPRVFSNTTVQKHQFFHSAFFIVQLLHPYVTTGKTTALTRQTFVGKNKSWSHCYDLHGLCDLTLNSFLTWSPQNSVPHLHWLSHSS